MRTPSTLSLFVASLASLAGAQQRDAPLTSLDSTYVNRTVTSGAGSEASPSRTAKLTIQPNGTSALVEDTVRVNGSSRPGSRARGALTRGELETLRVAIQAARVGAVPAQVSGPARDPAGQAFDLLVYGAPMPYAGRVRGRTGYVDPRYPALVELNAVLDRIEQRLRSTQAAETYGFSVLVFRVGRAQLVVRASGEVVLRERVFPALYLERGARLYPSELGQLGFDLQRARVGDLPAQLSLPGSRGQVFQVQVAAPGEVGGAVQGVSGQVAGDFQLAEAVKPRVFGLLLELERLSERLRRGALAGGVRVRFTR